MGSITSSACRARAIWRARRAARLRDRRHGLPPGGRRRDDGGGRRKADRPAGHLLRDARARSDQRHRRAPYRAPGLDADDPVRRPGRARRCASAKLSRSSTTARSSARSPNGSPRSTIRRAFPELVSRAFHIATSGRPGPVVIALPEDMLTEGVAVADAPPYEPVETHPALAADGGAAEAALGGRAADRRSSAERAGREAAGSASRGSPSASTFRSRARSGARCCSTALHPCYAGDVGLGVNPKLAGAHQGGRPGAAGRRAPRRDAVAEVHAVRNPGAAADAGARSSRTPTNSAASTARSSPSMPRRPGSRPRSKGCSRRTTIRWTRRDRARACRVPGLERPAPSRHPGAVQIWRGHGVSARQRFPPTRSSATAPAITPSGCTASAASAPTHASSRPTSGSMGYGVPAAIGAKRLHPERTVVCFAGDGDFLMNGQEFATAVQYDLPIIVVADRQRHVRHDPHAPGAGISRPRLGDGAQEPRLRRLCARLRRASASASRRRRSSRRPSSAARASGKPAILHLPDRSRGDHARHHPHGSSRKGAGRALSPSATGSPASPFPA